MTMRPSNLIWFRLSRFDRNVLMVMISLILLISIVVGVGDRVGTQVIAFSPLGKARNIDAIVMTFNETMDQASVQDRFQIEPPIEGNYIWSGVRMVFQPVRPLQTGSVYTVRLAKGARSTTARAVLSDYTFTFKVRSQRVAYLSPVDGSAPMNIWMVDPEDPSTAKSITAIEGGVNSYDVSPDGKQIALSARGTSRGIDIWLLNLETDQIQQLTDCVDSVCSLPVWSPDGKQIAYTQAFINANTADTQKGDFGLTLRGGLPRPWIIDLSGNETIRRPLLEDSQILGQVVNWSRDGQRVNVFNLDTGESFVYDFQSKLVFSIVNPYGQAGSLSPSGKFMLYPQFVQPDASKPLSLHLQLHDLEKDVITDVSGIEQGSQGDSNPVWNPSGDNAVFVRRDSANRPVRGAQVYLLVRPDNSLRLLIDDPIHTSGGFVWDASGAYLLMERFQVPSDSSQIVYPEIWSYSLGDNTLQLVMNQAVEPHWIP